MDESMLTGECMPVKKAPGDAVIGATSNKSGSLRYRATKVGADTALAQIVKLVQEAQNSKAPSQLLADVASQWLVASAIGIGLLTFVVWYWWIGQPVLFALTLTITVFVIARPDALGLATPMAVMVGTGLGALNGILFKNAAALEDATKLEVIVFDETGTLTTEQPEVVYVVAAPGVTEDAEAARTGCAGAMLAGDNRGTAERIVAGLGIALVLAEVLPGQKAEQVNALQAQGRKVGMVGAVELSRATLRKMHQNLFWAVSYNVIAFPLAARVFYPVVLSPEVAALAMSGSSALVAIAALLLKRRRLEGIHRPAELMTPTAVPTGG